MLALVALALAEPPPAVSLDEAVAGADLVIVATAQRVYFQALEPGASLKSNSHADFWMEYQVDRVLLGDAPVAPGETLRITFDAHGCEWYDFEISRVGDTFVETVDGGTSRTLDPAAWLPDGPQVLVLQRAPDGTVRHEVFGDSPAPATPEHLARVGKLIEARRPKKPARTK